MSGPYDPAGPPTALSALTVAGVPTIGTGGLLPFNGRYFFVNESTGSDGNTGSATDPFATLSQALSKCTANQNDVVFFTGTIHLSATLTWSKNQVHLIGLDAPLERGKRARISVTGSTAFTPMVSVTGAGCWFMNFATFYGFNSASNNAVCWADSGGRNCYDTVEILGFGDNTATTGTANRTAARAVAISGTTGENTFRNCVFGVDTTTRNATNYTLEFSGGSPRNYFLGCVFEGLFGSSGTSSAHIYAAASSAIDRYALFEDCKFFSDIKSTGSTLTQCINIAASVGGFLLMKDCTMVGITDWETTPTNQVFLDGASPTGNASGIAVNNS